MNDMMEHYRWSKRPLLVFAPGPESSVVRNQRAALAEAATEFLNRDMVHIEVLGDAVWIDRVESDSADADRLRRQYDIATAETAVLLVGKDGGVKLRRDTVVDPHTLYDLIDTMPMRLREIHRDGASR